MGRGDAYARPYPRLCVHGRPLLTTRQNRRSPNARGALDMMQNPEPSTTKQPSSFILTVNAGSSSIKFAVFTQNDSPERIITGQIERIGNPDAQLIAKRTGNATEDRQPIQADNHQSATESIAGYIRKQLGPGTIAAIGHRIVHGGLHLLEHQLITPEV